VYRDVGSPRLGFSGAQAQSGTALAWAPNEVGLAELLTVHQQRGEKELAATQAEKDGACTGCPEKAVIVACIIDERG
jgi:hypothetical protein